MSDGHDPDIVTARLVIAGRVQGVGYRETMRAVAGRCHITGWVRNRTDGTVEAFVQGEADRVEQIVAWCHRGPPGALVTGVRMEAVATEERFFSFSRWPTA